MGAVIVIGMHRSGTSLMTRLVEIAGAYVGTDDTLMEANEWNETGFWEDKRFAHINARLLESFGGWVYDPPVFPEGWVDSELVAPFRADARALLAKEFLPHPMWAVKDPRATLVLPFWRRLVENPRHVLCVRNPLDVAASLEKRDGMPTEFSVALWHAYTLRGLLDTDGGSRKIFLYEEIVRDPQATVEPLFAFVGAKERLADPAVRETIAQSVKPDLKHSEHSLADLLDHPDILTSTKQLYGALVAGDQAGLQSAIDQSHETLRVLHSITRPCGLMYKLYCDAFGSKKPKPRRHRAESETKGAGRVFAAATGWFGKSSRRAHAAEK